ncbi:MAG: hypothetical protein R2794_05305 [Chitinophagales bacterium]
MKKEKCPPAGGSSAGGKEEKCPPVGGSTVGWKNVSRQVDHPQGEKMSAGRWITRRRERGKMSAGWRITRRVQKMKDEKSKMKGFLCLCDLGVKQAISSDEYSVIENI